MRLKGCIRKNPRLIETARHNVAVTVNAGLTLLYWQIGSRIRQDILEEKRAEYGKEIVATLSQELTKEYGNGFSYSALTRMVRFAEIFPKKEIVSTLSQQLSWIKAASKWPNTWPNYRNVNCWSRNFTKRLNWCGNGWRQNLRSATQNTNDVRGKQKNPRQIRQIQNSTAIGGEKIAKENQYSFLDDINL